MPLKIAGRSTSNSVSSSFECSDRVENPPPVVVRQNPSERDREIERTLSYARTQVLCAWIMKSRWLAGKARTGADLGSISRRATQAVVLLADPCSPHKTEIGNGPAGRNAAVSHATSSRKSAVVTLAYFLSRSIEPSHCGSGSGPKPLGRRNNTGARSMTRHPSARISTLRHDESPRSR